MQILAEIIGAVVLLYLVYTGAMTVINRSNAQKTAEIKSSNVEKDNDVVN